MQMSFGLGKLISSPKRKKRNPLEVKNENKFQSILKDLANSCQFRKAEKCNTSEHCDYFLMCNSVGTHRSAKSYDQ